MKDTLNNDNIEEMIEMNKAEIDKEKPIIKTKAWKLKWLLCIKSVLNENRFLFVLSVYVITFNLAMK